MRIYSNQMLDSELINQVNVSLGSTDVDSPTAAATGSTVDYQTRIPFEDFGARLEGSYGWFDGGDYYPRVRRGRHRRVRPLGHPRVRSRPAWRPTTLSMAIAASIYKQQYNARIYQPIGNDGDFISLAVHYNQNRNNFFGSLPLRTDTISVSRWRPDPLRSRPVARRASSAPTRATASRSTATSAIIRSPLPHQPGRPRRASPMRRTPAAACSRSARIRRTPATSACSRASRWPTAWC